MEASRRTRRLLLYFRQSSLRSDFTFKKCSWQWLDIVVSHRKSNYKKCSFLTNKKRQTFARHKNRKDHKSMHYIALLWNINHRHVGRFLSFGEKVSKKNTDTQTRNPALSSTRRHQIRSVYCPLSPSLNSCFTNAVHK
jgi:hypothetical protein